LDSFYKRKKKRCNTKEIIQPCKICYKKTNAKNASLKREKYLKKAYDLSPQEYSELFQKQEGKCGICKTAMTTINIDHCHTTGKIRGLLCPECNRGLGLFYDDQKRLLSAAEYLNDNQN
jgi:hypothetical protein